MNNGHSGYGAVHDDSERRMWGGVSVSGSGELLEVHAYLGPKGSRLGQELPLIEVMKYMKEENAV